MSFESCLKTCVPEFRVSFHFLKPSLIKDVLLTCVNGAQDFKTESTRKLSNFNSLWTKTFYQKNLKNIPFFFPFFEG